MVAKERDDNNSTLSAKVFIALCNSQGRIPSKFFWSFLPMLANTPYQFYIYRADHPADTVRNNQAIAAFLKSDFDIFAKCDIDQTYPVDYFRILVPYTELYPVIGPVIFDRQEHNNYPTLAFREDRPYKDAEIDLINHGDRILKIPYTHTNNLYRREVLEAIDPPWYIDELNEDGTQRQNHVDYDFLTKIHDAGYSVYTHNGVVVNHLVEVELNRKMVARLRGK